MPSPDELRAIAERAKEIIDRDCFGEPSIKQLETWTLLGKLADAVLEQQNRIEELERENERLRYSHLPEAVEEPSDLENDFYDSATEGYSSNSRGMEHDDDGT